MLFFFQGLIAAVSSSKGRGNNDIALVEGLVTSYIKKPSCIILLTVTCESELPYLLFLSLSLVFVLLADFENQGATRLTKQYDPEGKRTVGMYHYSFIFCRPVDCSFIGVLTKPDRIPPGEAGNWLSFIRNEKEPLTNGWYAVKQPGSREIENGITWAEAREEEDRFFSTASGWCDLDVIYQKYLRTPNLVARLSEILSDLISKRFFCFN